MPYSITRGKGCSPSKPWAVVKDTDGSVVACHESKESALAQIRALYAAEPALAKARARMEKHLAGKHDQASHAKGGGTSSAVDSYVRDSVKINSGLRNGETPSGVAELDSAMAESKLPATTVYRVMEFKPSDSARYDYSRLEDVGDTVSDKAFVSTSTRRADADDFAVMGYKDKVVLKISVPEGTHGIKVSSGTSLRTGMGDQGEVILDRGATFRLTKPPKFSPNGTEYEVEVVSTNQSTVAKHLPGQHPQKVHGTGGGGTPDAGAPKKRNKKDIANDDQRASELYASGKTWDEVATEMGFANGGVARRAGKRHEERSKDGKPDEAKKPDETPDKPKPLEPTKPPEIVDVVTPPRPMEGKDPSQQLVPTNDIQEAMATGRPYAPLTHEGRTERARKAEDEYSEWVKERQECYEIQRAEIDRRIGVQVKARDEYNAKVEDYKSKNPRKDGESAYEHQTRCEAALAKQGTPKVTVDYDVERNVRQKLIDEGVFTPAEVARWDAMVGKSVGTNNVHDRLRTEIEIDTVEVLLGVKAERRPIMEPDWDAPKDPVTGQRPERQKTSRDWDPATNEYVDTPVAELGYQMPDGRFVKHSSIYNTNVSDASLAVEPEVIRATTQWRRGAIEQRGIRQNLIDGDGDGRYNEAMTEQLRRQQAVVDSPNTRIVVHAPLSAVGGITSDGFKSQLATGRGKGYKNRDDREGFEAGLLGVVHPKDDKSKAVIYAALHTGGVRHPDAIGAEQYGAVGFVLKRDVHQRATFTEGDSLSMCYEFSPLTGTQTQVNGHRNSGGVDVRLRGDTSPYGTSREQFDADITPAPRRSKAYREAQVLGGISIADVEYVTIPVGTKLPETARKRLVKAGVKIVEYDPVEASPGRNGVETLYPEKGKPYDIPRYNEGDWGNLPEPSEKAFIFAVNLFKFRRRHVSPEPLESLPIRTSWMNPTVVSKHLAGKHDQSAHGRGGGMGAPREQSHAKQKQAWELHKQGKTWEEVAKEAGYANGGAARLAGKAHEKRMKEKGDGSEVPKPDDVITPKPKPTTDKQGAKEIARAQAIIDEATGGRPVADVLAEERAKATSSDSPPTAKEIEVTEAVIKAGGILRGEVDRRRAIAGKDAIEVANADLKVLRNDLEVTKKKVDEVNAQRDAIRKSIHEEVTRSPEYERIVNERLDSRISRLDNEALTSAVQNDRSGITREIRTLSDMQVSGVNYGQRETWAKQRAEERFPNDKKAQKEYAEILEVGVWSAQSAERDLRGSNEKVTRLSDEDRRIQRIQTEETQMLYSVNREISDREALIRDGGVTPAQNDEIVRSVLTDSGRTMTDKQGQKLRGTKPVVAELRTELPKIPDELWNDQKFPQMTVEGVKRGRGHWNSADQRIKTDGDKGSGRRASTLLHESMHAVEDMNPQIKQLQFVMMARRAKGQSPQKLSKIVKGSGYRADEVAIEDAWSNPYSGKIYNVGGRRNNFEIMTMGIESLYKRRNYPANPADEDHLNFVMGVLAHA